MTESTTPPSLPPTTGGSDCTLIMLRGLPGAGKTTRARQLVTADPTGSTVRVGVDDLATMLYGTNRPAGIGRTIWASAISQITTMFRNGMRTVILDAPNLSPAHEHSLTTLADAYGARLVVDDLGTDVDECVRRNALRHARGERSVHPETITALAEHR